MKKILMCSMLIAATLPSVAIAAPTKAPSSKETQVFYAMVNSFLDYLGARLKGRRVIPALASAFKKPLSVLARSD